MAEPFHFELVSPERQLMSEDVEMVVVPGTEGDFGVLKDHAPVISTIRPGYIDVTKVGGEVERIFVFGGFADTGPTGLTVLADKAVHAEELDRDELARTIRDLEEDVADATDEDRRAAISERLEHLRNVAAAL